MANKTYKVNTTFGTTFNRVKSWRKWDIDESFLVFTQWKYYNENEGEYIEFIIKINDIESIQEQ